MGFLRRPATICSLAGGKLADAREDNAHNLLNWGRCDVDHNCFELVVDIVVLQRTFLPASRTRQPKG